MHQKHSGNALTVDFSSLSESVYELLEDVFMLTILDFEGKIKKANERFQERFASSSELYMRDFKSFQDKRQSTAFIQNAIDIAMNGERWKGELCLVSKNSVSNWFTCLFVPIVRNEHEHQNEVVCLLLEISEKGSLEHWQQLATCHEITGLPNRRMLQQELDALSERAIRTDNRFAVLFMDINQFKLINDTFGHSVGDWFLKEIADRLQKLTTLSNRIFHVGGDEFIFLIEEIDHIESNIAEIIEVFDGPFTLESIYFEASVSIGISIFPDHSIHPKRLIEYADTAMFEAKLDRRLPYKIFGNEILQQKRGRNK